MLKTIQTGQSRSKVLLVLIATSVPLLIANLIGKFAIHVSSALFIVLPWLMVFYSIKKMINQRNVQKLLFLFVIFAALRAIAETIWISYESVLKIDPFPSPADFLWLSGNSALFLFLLLNSKGKKVSKSAMVVSISLSIAFIIPVLFTVYGPNVDSNPFELAILLAYPISDVMILFFAIIEVIGMKTAYNDKFLLFTVCGIASFVISDTLFIVSQETYESGNMIDIGWIFGYCFFTFAILNFRTKLSTIRHNESHSIRYDMITKFVVPLAIFAGFAIILSYAANTYPAIQDTHDRGLIEGIMYIVFSIMAILAVVAFFINKNTDHLVKKITKQLESERNALKAKNEENDLLLQKLESQNLKLREIDKLKDEFSSMITHELKTPLAPILSWSGVLKSQKDFDKDPIRVKAIQKIESNTLKLSQLISDILDAEKLELCKMPFHKKEFFVSDLVDDIYENYKNIMEKQSISFNVTHDQRIAVVSDIDRIEQVLKNFINNSMDFVPKSDGKIELKIEQHDDMVSFYVVDNGIGISKEYQQNLFKKFYQIDNSMTRRHGGSGLGLSICKEIVENLGGTVGVESELGKGSTFYFRIPIKHSDFTN